MKRMIFALLAVFGFSAGSMTPASSASLVAHIDVSSQTMTVSQSGQVLYNWKVSTGRNGYYTPRGTFRPQHLARMHYSRKYDNSPMPHSIFFRGGYAIHGTGAVKRLGTPASHGCVRLHPSNAATLFSMTKQVGPKNVRIVITN